MTSRTPAPGNTPPGNIPPAVDAWLDGIATEADFAELDAWLAADPANAREILDLAIVHHGSAIALQHPAEKTTKPDDVKKETEGSAPQTAPLSAAGVPMYRKGYEPQPFKFRAHHYALIAATLLAACGLAIYLLAFSAAPIDDPDPVDPNQTGPSVATLIHNTGNLRTPHGYPAEGDDYSAGEYTLASGTAEFMLTNSVNVKLRGDTRLHMRHDMNVSLTRGSAEFVVPPGAKGFTVELPGQSQIIDFGTAFSASIDEAGETRVHVTEGAVEIVERSGIRHKITMGWGAHVAEGHIAWIEIPMRSVTLTPVADTYINRLYPDKVLGGEPIIVANEWNKSGPRWSYLRFDLSEIEGPVTHAMLNLTTKVGQKKSLDRYEVYGLLEENDWSERGDGAMTWNNAPARADDRVDLTRVVGGAPLATFVAEAGEGDSLTAFDNNETALLAYLNNHRGETVTLIIAASLDTPGGHGDAWASRETPTPPTLILQTFDRIDSADPRSERSDSPSKETPR